MQKLSETQEKTVRIEGLTILGTEFGCGKTALTTGLTALLNEQGFQAQAIKPIVTGSPSNWQAELSFMSTITHTPLDYGPVQSTQGSGITSDSWRNTIINKKTSLGPILIELPGSCATPLLFESDRAWLDSCDLAFEFGNPCVLVAKHEEEMLEKLSVYAKYIKSKYLELIGLISVEVTEPRGPLMREVLTRTQIEFLLQSKTQTPYLGCIKYSPSISVPNVKQGNLIKLTSAGLEILGLIKALNLKVPLK